MLMSSYSFLLPFTPPYSPLLLRTPFYSSVLPHLYLYSLLNLIPSFMPS